MSALTPSERAFVAAARVGHLATASPTLEPHVVPVCYAVVDDAAYVLIDRKPKQSDDFRKLKRVANILANPQACLTVDRYDDDWTRLAFVMMRGTATLIADGPRYEQALSVLLQRYPQYHDQQLSGRPMISMEITTVSSWGRV